METRIALLRGINVGGKHIVPMKELRSLLEANGYKNVRTYIQSGNVIYDLDKKTDAGVGDLIMAKYGFEPAVITLCAKDFRTAVETNPYNTDIGKTVHFFFCEGDLGIVDIDLLNALKAPSEEFELIGNVFYLHAPDGIGRSKLVAKIDKAFKGINITARNLNTVNKILQLM